MLISSSKSRCWERCGAVLVHRFLCEGNNGMNYNSRKLFSVAVVIAPLPAWHSAGETYKSAGVFPDLNVCKKVKLDETWGETSDCLILTRRSQEKHVDVGNILNTSSPSFYLHGSRKGIFIKRSNMIINNTNISISTLLISLKIFKTAHPHSSMTLEITWRWSRSIAGSLSRASHRITLSGVAQSEWRAGSRTNTARRSQAITVKPAILSVWIRQDVVQQKNNTLLTSIFPLWH